ncbi:MAG: metallopeptidase TldD-related protein [Candidatus Anstonellales archaeon]
MYNLIEKIAEEIKNDLEKGIKICKTKNLEKYEVFESCVINTSLGIEKNSIKNYENTFSRGFTCRVLVNGKYALMSSSNLEECIDNSIKYATYNELLNDYDFINERNRVTFLIQKQKLFEEKEMEEIARNLIIKEKNYTTTIGEVSNSIVIFGVANSSGIFKISNKMSVSAFAAINYKNSSSSFGIVGKNKRTFYEQLKEFEYAKSVAKKFSTTRKISENGRKRKVIFRREALAELIEFLIPSIIGINLATNSTNLKLFEKNFSEEINLYNLTQHTLLPKTLMDGEGIISKEKELIRKGTLENIILNSENLHKIKKNNKEKIDEYEKLLPGNCNRIDFSQKIGESFNIPFLKPGKGFDYEHEDLIIEEIQGMHTSNPLSGNFSVSVEHGYLINKFSEEIPLKKFNLSANIFDILKNCYLAKEVKIIAGTTIAPEIKTEAIITA